MSLGIRRAIVLFLTVALAVSALPLAALGAGEEAYQGTYAGEYDASGRRSGQGTWTYHNYVYVGQWENDLPNGQGTLYSNGRVETDGVRYVEKSIVQAQWVNGVGEGMIEESFVGPSGDLLTFRSEVKNGQTLNAEPVQSTDGTTSMSRDPGALVAAVPPWGGAWADDTLPAPLPTLANDGIEAGSSTAAAPSSQESSSLGLAQPAEPSPEGYVGELDEGGKRTGFGTWVHQNYRYEGYWENDMPNGQGTLYCALDTYDPAVSLVQGNWVDGLAEGDVTYYQWNAYELAPDFWQHTPTRSQKKAYPLEVKGGVPLKDETLYDSTEEKVPLEVRTTELLAGVPPFAEVPCNEKPAPAGTTFLNDPKSMLLGEYGGNYSSYEFDNIDRFTIRDGAIYYHYGATGTPKAKIALDGSFAQMIPDREFAYFPWVFGQYYENNVSFTTLDHYRIHGKIVYLEKHQKNGTGYTDDEYQIGMVDDNPYLTGKTLVKDLGKGLYKLIFVDDEWVYYTSCTKDLFGYSDTMLRRIRLDGTDQQDVIPPGEMPIMSSAGINIVGEYVYYVDGYGEGITRRKVDGGGKKGKGEVVVPSEFGGIYDLVVVEDNLYFLADGVSYQRMVDSPFLTTGDIYVGKLKLADAAPDATAQELFGKTQRIPVGSKPMDVMKYSIKLYAAGDWLYCQLEEADSGYNAQGLLMIRPDFSEQKRVGDIMAAAETGAPAQEQTGEPAQAAPAQTADQPSGGEELFNTGVTYESGGPLPLFGLESYEGERDAEGKRSGQGTWIYKNFRYEGQWENDMPNGQGTLYETLMMDPDTFEMTKRIVRGAWKDGFAQGAIEMLHVGREYTQTDSLEVEKGIATQDGVYAKGMMAGGVPPWAENIGANDGVPAPLASDEYDRFDLLALMVYGAEEYQGERDAEGKRSGFGTWTYHNYCYEGQWENDLPNGEGTLYITAACYKNGQSIPLKPFLKKRILRGTWVNGLAHGKIEDIYPDDEQGAYVTTFAYDVQDGCAVKDQVVKGVGVYYEVTEDSGALPLVKGWLAAGVPPFAEVAVDSSLPAPQKTVALDHYHGRKPPFTAKPAFVEPALKKEQKADMAQMAAGLKEYLGVDIEAALNQTQQKYGAYLNPNITRNLITYALYSAGTGQSTYHNKNNNLSAISPDALADVNAFLAEKGEPPLDASTGEGNIAALWLAASIYYDPSVSYGWIFPYWDLVLPFGLAQGDPEDPQGQSGAVGIANTLWNDYINVLLDLLGDSQEMLRTKGSPEAPAEEAQDMEASADATAPGEEAPEAAQAAPRQSIENTGMGVSTSNYRQRGQIDMAALEDWVFLADTQFLWDSKNLNTRQHLTHPDGKTKTAVTVYKMRADGTQMAKIYEGDGSDGFAPSFQVMDGWLYAGEPYKMQPGDMTFATEDGGWVKGWAIDDWEYELVTDLGDSPVVLRKTSLKDPARQVEIARYDNEGYARQIILSVEGEWIYLYRLGIWMEATGLDFRQEIARVKTDGSSTLEFRRIEDDTGAIEFNNPQVVNGRLYYSVAHTTQEKANEYSLRSVAADFSDVPVTLVPQLKDRAISAVHVTDDALYYWSGPNSTKREKTWVLTRTDLEGGNPTVVTEMKAGKYNISSALIAGDWMLFSYYDFDTFKTVPYLLRLDGSELHKLGEPFVAQNAQGAVDASGKWRYELLPDGTAMILGPASKLKLSGKLAIPGKVDQIPVTAIGANAFYGYDRFTGVSIPKSVTAIGDFAFFWCKGLTAVTVPEGVISIGTGAFKSCAKVKKMALPASLESVGEQAFTDCPAIKLSVSKKSEAFEVVDGALFDRRQNMAVK